MRKYCKHASFLLLLILLLTGCREKNTENPEEVYKLWTGSEPPIEVNVIRGKFWQSPHLTKEYEMYLELKASPLWRKEFILQNGLMPDTSSTNLPPQAPIWFRPTENHRILVPSGFGQGSVYYEDTTTHHMFIYEIQL